MGRLLCCSFTPSTWINSGHPVVAKSYPKQDVKSIALNKIAHIAKNQAIELYIAALLDPKYREKAVVICAIADYGDETALDALIGRVRKILAMKTANTSDR